MCGFDVYFGYCVYEVFVGVEFDIVVVVGDYEVVCEIVLVVVCE